MNPINRRPTEKKKSKTEVKNYTNQVPGPTNSTQKKIIIIIIIIKTSKKKGKMNMAGLELGT